jgi:hypothetical protein
MNGNVRAAVDVTGGVLACAALGSAAVVVMQLLAPTHPFSCSVEGAKRFAAIAVGAAIVFLLAFVGRRAAPQLQLAVTRRLALVVIALATYETLWFGALVPRLLADIPLSNSAVLALEIGPVALISVLVWGGRSMNMKTRIGLFAVAGVLCVIGAALINPAVLYGIAEQSGWLRQSAQHVSGVHELPLRRHLAYLVLASLAGLSFVRGSKQSAEGSPPAHGAT